MAPSSIAILGGGITGLSAAFHLSKRFPSSTITLLEKSHRLGGWVQSKRVEFGIPGGDIGSSMLEMGPRTLRPQSKAILELVNLLNLTSHLITTPKNAPAAKNRFLYLADSRKPGLTPIPSSIIGHLTSPLSLIAVPSVVLEAFRRPNRPEAAEDESLDSFMSRRFGAEFARVFGSALVHGIYAADSRKLSIRTAFRPVWDMETRGNGSLVKGIYKSRSRPIEPPMETAEYETAGLENEMKQTAVYSFREGLGTLTNALEQYLERVPNVELRLGSDVTNLEVVDGSFKISTSAGPLSSSHLVSTIPLPRLETILSGSQLPHLTTNPYASVTVVSFVFASPPSQIHPPGFGYLIPRPKGGYEIPVNPEGVLGVVFDSCSVDAQDRPQGQMTKLTMMLGGPYPHFSTESDDPSVVGAALFGTLERHLGRQLPNPVHLSIWHHKNCIPTPAPGHLQRMDELKDALQGDPWRGQMEVIGAGIGGVSVGDCVEQSRKAGSGWM